jgi:Zn-dependent peptidase ImmA (M78 family)
MHHLKTREQRTLELARMKINPAVSFISNTAIEASAYGVLERYGREFEPITELPVPVERIADFMLQLGIDWGPIADNEENPVLAFIDPEGHRIRINERHMPRFKAYPGMLEFTLAHEIGHHELHLLQNGIEQFEMDFTCDGVPLTNDDAAMLARSGVSSKGYLCRESGSQKDAREAQADRFASYLLLPEHLLLPAVEGVNLLSWTTLYRLRDQFAVSISALTIRLSGLGLLYVSGKLLYRSEAEAMGMQRML